MDIIINSYRLESLIRNELSLELQTRVHRIACEAASGIRRDLPGEYNNRLDFTDLSRLLGTVRSLYGAEYDISSLYESQHLPGGAIGECFCLPVSVSLEIPGCDTMIIHADWARVSGYDPINELIRLPDDLLADPEWDSFRGSFGFVLESEPDEEDKRPIYSDEQMLRAFRKIAESCRAAGRTMPPSPESCRNLRDLRLLRGLTQKALASAAGINLRQIQKLESGEIKPENLTLKNALALAAALGVEPKDLI